MGQTGGRKSWARSSWSHTHLPVEKQHWKRRHQLLPTTWFPVPWWMQPANTCPETLCNTSATSALLATHLASGILACFIIEEASWMMLHQLSQHQLTDHPRTDCHSVPAQPEKENKWLNGASPLRSTRWDKNSCQRAPAEMSYVSPPHPDSRGICAHHGLQAWHWSAKKPSLNQPWWPPSTAEISKESLSGYRVDKDPPPYSH